MELYIQDTVKHTIIYLYKQAPLHIQSFPVIGL